MITGTGRFWFPLLGQLDCQQRAFQRGFTLNSMEEPGWTNFKAKSNLCLLMICNPRYQNLTRLGRIWLAGGASSLGLRLIPLITFCNQTVLLKNSELGSDTEANNQGFWFPATNEFYHHLHISQIWQLIEVLFATLLAKMAFAHVL